MSRFLLKNRSTLRGIRGSLSSFSEGLTAANKNILNIRKTLSEGNRQKKKALSTSFSLFARRRAAVRRAEQEDIVEASNLGSLTKRTPTKIASSSTRGVLGRIFDIVGSVLVGWAVLNLPKILKGAEELREKLKNIYSTVSTWFNRTLNFFNIFNSELDTKSLEVGNLLNFDPDKKEIDKLSKSQNESLDKIQTHLLQARTSLESLTNQSEIDKLFGNETATPSPQGNAKSQNPSQTLKATSAQTPLIPQSQPMSGQGTSKTSLAKMIRGAEGSGYGSVYTGHLKGFRRGAEDITQMTISQLVQFQKDYLAHQAAKGVPADKRSAAVGAYQMLKPEEYVNKAGLKMSDKFTPENQDKLFEAYLEGRGMTRELARTDPKKFSELLSKAFAGVPVTSDMQGYVQPVERGQSFYRGYGSNKSTMGPQGAEQVEAAIKEFGQGSVQPQPNQSNFNTSPRTRNFAKNTGPRTIPIPIPTANNVAQAPPQSQSSGGSQLPEGTELNSGMDLAKKILLSQLEYT